MKRRPLALLLGLTFLMGAEPPQAARPASWNEPESPRIKTSLLVQVALQQGREFIASGDHASAIRVLEAHLPKINGDAVYLQALEQAYRGHVNQLKQKGDHELAHRYLQKLAVFDPGITISESVKQTPTAAQPSLAPQVKVRGAGGEVDLPKGEEGDACLARAKQAFQSYRFAEAAGHYEQALAARTELDLEAREQWAYCKLHRVAEQINQAATPDWTALEREVRTALSLASGRSDGRPSAVARCGESLLQDIAGRSRVTATPPAAPCEVRHQARGQNGWQVAETANFRILHADPKLAEKVARVAEQTRAAVLDKWLGDTGPSPWPCKCDIYLHATGEAYARATGAPAESPGHSSIGAERHDASRLTSLRIDLHADNPSLLIAVLPHETTHVALAGRFGIKPLARWADEGMAVLSEPYDKINRHLRGLPQSYQDGRAFSVAQLATQDDYPGTGALFAFYGQSTALVYYMTELKGPRVFAEFLKTSQREGYEAALRRHYDLRDWNELEQQWRPFAASGKEIAPPALARGRQ